MVRTPATENNTLWAFHISSCFKSHTTSFIKQIFKTLSPMAIRVRWISLTLKQLLFLYWSEWGVLYDLINVLGPFLVILQPWNFCKVEFTCICSAREISRKSQNTSNFWILTRIWIIQICEVLWMGWIFKSGNFFLAHPVLCKEFCCWLIFFILIYIYRLADFSTVVVRSVIIWYFLVEKLQTEPF